MLVREPSFEQTEDDLILQLFKVNALGAFNMAQAFLKHLQNGRQKVLANLSSSMGSIAENTSGGYYSYRTSKTALNMLMRSAGHDLAKYGIKVLLLHPGWAQTRMGGESAMVPAPTSVAGMREIIANYNPPAGETLFYRYNGTIVPW